MRTINFIEKTAATMLELQIPANVEIGSFKLTSTGSLHNWAGRSGEFNFCEIIFRIQFRPDHIQHLMLMGVKIDLNHCVMAELSPKALRFKQGREAIKQGRYAPYYYMGNPENAQTGVIENWLSADAS